MKVDAIVVGQGLAGSLIAWNYILRGKKVAVIDPLDSVSASRIAAGLIAPIAGQRLTLAWRLDELLPFAIRFYRDLETRVGKKLYHEVPTLRTLENDLARDRYQIRKEDPHFQAQTEDRTDKSFVMKHSGFLDVPSFLQATHRELVSGALYFKETFQPNDLQIAENDVSWKGLNSSHIVFCQGYQKGVQNPWFDWIPFRPSKGEILRGNLRPWGDGRIHSFGKWIVPLSDGAVRAGSTYDWNAEHPLPTDSGRKEIVDAIERYTGSRFDVVDHQAAFRPVIRHSKLLMGRHPKHASLAFFNGLGSKGSLHGPCFANQLVEHLLEGNPVDEEVDLQKNL